MELRDYFDLLRRRWLVLVVTALVGMALAFSATNRTARYEASAVVLVGPQRIDFDTTDPRDSNLSLDRIVVIDRLLLTYSTMVRSRTVAAGAVEKLGVDRSPESVIGAVEAEVVTGTQLLRITATDIDPGTARDLANAMAESFVDEVRAVEQPVDDETTGVLPAGVPVAIFEPADIPVTPRPTGLLGNLVLGAVFGFLAAAAASIAVDALDVTFRSAQDAERRLGVPVLGAVPVLRHPGQLVAWSRAEARLAARTQPQEPADA